MQSLDVVVIRQALNWIDSGKTIWLCTVIRTYGSAPRVPGALFCAINEGSYVGSLSGGCIEEDFLCRIANGEFQQDSQLIKYGENGFEPNKSLPCGGTIEVLVEQLKPLEDSFYLLSQMLRALRGELRLSKVVTIPNMAKMEEVDENAGLSEISINDSKITLNMNGAPRLFIACLSSVAHYCIEYAHSLGFEVIVCEHRKEEYEQLINMPHLLNKVTLHSSFPATYLEENGCHNRTAIIALTHDPRIDDLTMIEACNTSAFYVGAMGSAKNSNKRRDRLKEHAGLAEEQVSRIHAPIGLDIGSKTPSEIALAILADIVLHMRKGKVFS